MKRASCRSSGPARPGFTPATSSLSWCSWGLFVSLQPYSSVVGFSAESAGALSSLLASLLCFSTVTYSSAVGLSTKLVPEKELKDWEESQLARDYHLLRAYLEHDVRLLNPSHAAESGQVVRGNIREIEDLLGNPPRPRPHPWRSTSHIVDNLSDWRIYLMDGVEGSVATPSASSPSTSTLVDSSSRLKT